MTKRSRTRSPRRGRTCRRPTAGRGWTPSATPPPVPAAGGRVPLPQHPQVHRARRVTAPAGRGVRSGVRVASAASSRDLGRGSDKEPAGSTRAPLEREERRERPLAGGFCKRTHPRPFSHDTDTNSVWLPRAPQPSDGQHGARADAGRAVDLREADPAAAGDLAVAGVAAQLQHDLVDLAQPGRADRLAVGEAAAVGVDRQTAADLGLAALDQVAPAPRARRVRSPPGASPRRRTRCPAAGRRRCRRARCRRARTPRPRPRRWRRRELEGERRAEHLERAEAPRAEGHRAQAHRRRAQLRPRSAAAPARARRRPRRASRTCTASADG